MYLSYFIISCPRKWFDRLFQQKRMPLISFISSSLCCIDIVYIAMLTMLIRYLVYISIIVIISLCQHDRHFDVDDVDTCTSSSSFSFPFCRHQRHCRHFNFEGVDAIASLPRHCQSSLYRYYWHCSIDNVESISCLHRHWCYNFPFVKFVDILDFSVWIWHHHWRNCWHRYVEQCSFNGDN